VISLKKYIQEKHFSLTPAPVIPTTQKVVIRRIAVPGQSRQKSLQDLISMEKKKSRMWWHVPVIPVTAGVLK
jgi:hypothetical protein